MKLPQSGRALALLLTVAASAWATPAQAFCRATTCDPAKESCNVDGTTQCITTGQPLAWHNACITINIQADGAPKARISPAATAELVQRAFDTWLNVDCGDGQRPSIDVVVGGPVECATSEYSMDHHNANIVMFREEAWPYKGAEDALGLTRLRFNKDTGELWDADIELNTLDEPLSVDDPEDDEVDLASLITHEVGHLLGLGHTLTEGATMQAGYHNGSTQLRTLQADDIAGICAIYPPEREVASQSCEPKHGFSELCAADQGAFVEPPAETDDDEEPRHYASDCSVVAPGAPVSSGGLTLLSVGLLALLRRRR